MLQWPFGAALSRQLRAMAEFAEALKQAANLRRGILVARAGRRAMRLCPGGAISEQHPRPFA